MRDRLRELMRQAEFAYLDFWKMHSCEKSLTYFTVGYLLENGVIALPVNAGDTIYRPFGRGVESWVVTTIVLHPDEIVFIDDSENSFKESHIGVSTFLTREEAEAKLKGGVE